jgi:hypothetical protein
MLPELSVTSSTFTGPVIEIINGNSSFNSFFSIVFYLGGISYICGSLVSIIRGSR